MLKAIVIIVLCVVSVTDLRSRKIPNNVLLFAIGVRFMFFLTELFWGKETISAGLMLLGDGLLVSLPLFLLTLLIEAIWRKKSLGGGDIKLLFVTGLYLGGEANLWVVFLASVFALFWKKLQGVKQKVDRYIPLAPSISLAAVLVLFAEKIHIK